MTSTTDRLVDDYLERLRGELADVPRAQRREVVDEIAEHIAEARSALPSETELEIRNLLDRVGEPAEIAAEARERFGVRPARRGWVEIAALVLLLVGGVVVPVVGWIAGAVLLWISDVWSTRDKLIGTLVVPGGLLVPFVLMMYPVSSAEVCGTTYDARTGEVVNQQCTGGPSPFMEIVGPIVLVLAVAAPVATTIYLAGRMKRATAPAVA